MRTIGIDVSRWQDNPHTEKNIDLSKAVAQGARYVFIRAGIGDKQDRNFEKARQNAIENNMLWGSYWYFYYKTNVLVQAEKYIQAMDGNYGNLPMVLDIEKPLPLKRDREWYLNACKVFVDTIEEAQGRKAIIYANPSFFKHYLGYGRVPEWMLERDLWIAHYIRKPEEDEPTFKPWDKWLFWQYTDRGDGIAHGMESKQVDMNFFNGSLEELRAYAKQSGTPVPPPPPNLTVEEKVDRLWQSHPEIW